jgi:hypothetical protein
MEYERALREPPIKTSAWNEEIRKEKDWTEASLGEIEEDPEDIRYIETPRDDTLKATDVTIGRQVQIYGYTERSKSKQATNGENPKKSTPLRVKFNIDDGAEVGLAREDFVKTNLNNLGIRRIRWFNDEEQKSTGYSQMMGDKARVTGIAEIEYKMHPKQRVPYRSIFYIGPMDDHQDILLAKPNLINARADVKHRRSYTTVSFNDNEFEHHVDHGSKQVTTKWNRAKVGGGASKGADGTQYGQEGVHASIAKLEGDTIRPSDDEIQNLVTRHGNTPQKWTEKFSQLLREYRDVLYKGGYLRALNDIEYEFEYKGGEFNQQAIPMNAKERELINTMFDDQVASGQLEERFFIDDEYGGLLRREEITKDGHCYNQLVVPATLQQQVIADHHNTNFSAHGGKNYTTQRVRRQYFWDGMATDIDNYVTSCGD